MMMTEATALRNIVEYDPITKHFIARVGGPGDPIAWSSSKQLLEEFLDYLEERERTRETVPRDE